MWGGEELGGAGSPLRVFAASITDLCKTNVECYFLLFSPFSAIANIFSVFLLVGENRY